MIRMKSYLTVWDIWNGKAVDLEKSLADMNFRSIMMKAKKPTFRSDRYQFTVVMPNLNYNVPQDVPRNGTQDVPLDVPRENRDNPLVIQILNMIKKDNKVSTEKMAMALGISSKTVKRHIKDLDIIQFVGRGCNGHWEIIKKEKVISQQNSDTPQA